MVRIMRRSLGPDEVLQTGTLPRSHVPTAAQATQVDVRLPPLLGARRGAGNAAIAAEVQRLSVSRSEDPYLEEDEPVEDPYAMEDEPVEDPYAMEDEPVEDPYAMEDEPVEDPYAMEDEPKEPAAAPAKVRTVHGSSEETARSYDATAVRNVWANEALTRWMLPRAEMLWNKAKYDVDLSTPQEHPPTPGRDELGSARNAMDAIEHAVGWMQLRVEGLWNHAKYGRPLPSIPGYGPGSSSLGSRSHNSTTEITALVSRLGAVEPTVKTLQPWVEKLWNHERYGNPL